MLELYLSHKLLEAELHFFLHSPSNEKGKHLRKKKIRSQFQDQISVCFIRMNSKLIIARDHWTNFSITLIC